jgi:hypothetical protein
MATNLLKTNPLPVLKLLENSGLKFGDGKILCVSQFLPKVLVEVGLLSQFEEETSLDII